MPNELFVARGGEGEVLPKGEAAPARHHRPPVFRLYLTGGAIENYASASSDARAQPAFLRCLSLASDSSTCREKTYSAGRWFSSEISGTISPSVVTPLTAMRSAFSGCFTESMTAVASY